MGISLFALTCAYVSGMVALMLGLELHSIALFVASIPPAMDYFFERHKK